jgi:hypothetical protein
VSIGGNKMGNQPPEFDKIKKEILFGLDVYKNAKPGYMAHDTTHNICVKVVYPLLQENERLKKKIDELTVKPDKNKKCRGSEVFGSDPKENYDWITG